MMQYCEPMTPQLVIPHHIQVFLVVEIDIHELISGSLQSNTNSSVH